MKKNGFISSALLYGMLALFLVIMTSTLAILGNQKLSMDKLKENALNDVQYDYVKTENLYALYDGFQAPKNNIWKDQSGNNHDATLKNFSAQSYNDKHLNFNGTTSYIDTGIKQSDLGNKITISTVLNIQEANGGIWGLYNETEGNGIYAELQQPEDVEGGIIKICSYTKLNTPVCTDVALSNLIGSTDGNPVSYLNKKIQLVVVIQSGSGMDIYLNGVSYDSIESNLELNLREDNLIIGQATAGDLYLKGELYNFTIYNIGLTEEEIYKNFEVDNIRYKITSWQRYKL